jgi:hypothetical protein
MCLHPPAMVDDFDALNDDAMDDEASSDEELIIPNNQLAWVRLWIENVPIHHDVMAAHMRAMFQHSIPKPLHHLVRQGPLGKHYGFLGYSNARDCANSMLLPITIDGGNENEILMHSAPCSPPQEWLDKHHFKASYLPMCSENDVLSALHDTGLPNHI